MFILKLIKVEPPKKGVYAASKRSLEIVSETIRLELLPFKISVLSIVTGAVQTNGQTYFEDFSLPQDSLYKDIESTIAARARGEDGVKRMPAKEYAEKVVANVLDGAAGKVWLGMQVNVVKYGSTFAPQGIMVS
jgi:1-acylglycerone phosphate reductase